MRSSVAGLVGGIGPAAKDMTAPLAETLLDPEWTVRAAAADALGRIGTGAQAAIPALRELVRRGTATDRQLALNAMTRIKQSEASFAVPSPSPAP